MKSLETLQTQANKARKEYNQIPTVGQLRKHGVHQYHISKLFGNYDSFYEHMGWQQERELQKLNTVVLQTPEERECPQCNEKFVATRHKTKFCSVKCSNRSRRKDRELKTKHIHETKNCVECDSNVPYTSRRYHKEVILCSRLCQQIYDMKQATKGDLEKRTHSNRYDLIRWRARNFIKNHRELKCQICGYDNHAEICHIKPISEFEDTATLYEINNLDNIMILCPNHHWEFDHGLMSEEDLGKL